MSLFLIVHTLNTERTQCVAVHADIPRTTSIALGNILSKPQSPNISYLHIVFRMFGTSTFPTPLSGIPQSSRGSGASCGVAQSGGRLCFRCASPSFCGHPVHVRPPVRPPPLQFPVQPREDSCNWDEPQAGGGSRGLLQVFGGRFHGGRAGGGVVGGDQGRRQVHQGTEVRPLAACLPVFPSNSFHSV